jgi:hypothetical protein
MRRALPLTLLLALLLPSGAQAREVSVSAARAETAYYAQTLVERGAGMRFRVHSCRRRSPHSVSCGFRIYGPRGYRCDGRVSTAQAARTSYDTISRAVVDRCA